ncbi:Rho termination factor [Chelatococcus sambhunathii]|uniref:Rho termination factor n=1 Tax=Chelatococcus sambhunathii TaxID=363953 RepID=A0ABU1DJB9_9HYPH|nr:Rho termination factor N-terminal domain-containing protein [Chelatococcus sambhunathii]MDR4308113.1 Rho termination factor [Chelatococcus sambhunathii]
MAATKASRKSPKANPSIKNPEVYEALREQGASAEKAARISNAQAKYGNKGPDAPSRKGGKSPDYEEWTRDDLYSKAKEIGISGLSRSTKDELIHALRSH